MKSSTKRILSIFASIALFFYAAFSIFSEIVPAWARLSGIRTEIAEREMARDQLEELIEKARDFLSRTGELERKTRPIYASLPVTPEIPELIAILSAVSSKNKIALSSMRFETEEFRQIEGAKTKGPSISKVKARINIAGKYSDLKNWLKDIESELRLIDVHAMNLEIITREQAAGADTPISAEVLLFAYWQQKITQQP